MNQKKSIFKNPGIIMTILQLLYACIIFAWFPTERGWFEIPIIAWLMILGFFIWGLQAIIFVYWAEKIEKSTSDEVNSKVGFGEKLNN